MKKYIITTSLDRPYTNYPLVETIIVETDDLATYITDLQKAHQPNATVRTNLSVLMIHEV